MRKALTALLLAVSPFLVRPAFAAQSIIAADGRRIVVWERRAPRAGETAAPAGLAYAVLRAGQARVGLVDATGDATADAAPRLALAPDGTPVLLWSRLSAGALRIAYARLENDRWSDVHDVTFGPGDEIEPRVIADAHGAWLFWIGGGRHRYAPLDLSGGRLHAVPQDLTTEAMDVPITTGRCNGGGEVACSNASTLTPPAPRDPTTAAMDAPVTTGGTGSSKNDVTGVWAAASSACGRHALVVPSSDGTALVLGFADGVARVLTRLPLPASIPAGFGEALARSHSEACE